MEGVGHREGFRNVSGLWRNGRMTRVSFVTKRQGKRIGSMLKDLSDSITDGLIAIISLSLLVAGAAGAVTFAYFAVMCCWRLIGSLHLHLFFPWP
jgi:hypothetical protein